MEKLTRLGRLTLIFLTATACSSLSVAAETGIVTWNLGSQTILSEQGTNFVFTPVGPVTGTFTYALGGGPVDWDIVTPGFPAIPSRGVSPQGSVTLTPLNSSSTASTPGVFRLTAFNVLLDILPSGNNPALLNQPGSITPFVGYSFGGRAATSFGTQPIIIGVLAVPEPQTYAMLCLGLVVLALAGRRSAKS
ncbi:MAG: hypothetical protein JWR21_68 [Herminiimonas sp.]|nr:hypothetical protein [Herminiimonas sp.]